MTSGSDILAAFEELKQMFPDQARKISVTETALGRHFTVVIGGLSTTHRTMEECMMVVRRKWQPKDEAAHA